MMVWNSLLVDIDGLTLFGKVRRWSHWCCNCDCAAVYFVLLVTCHLHERGRFFGLQLFTAINGCSPTFFSRVTNSKRPMFHQNLFVSDFCQTLLDIGDPCQLPYWILTTSWPLGNPQNHRSNQRWDTINQTLSCPNKRYQMTFFWKSRESHLLGRCFPSGSKYLLRRDLTPKTTPKHILRRCFNHFGPLGFVFLCKQIEAKLPS